MQSLAVHQRVPPSHLWGQPLPTELVTAMATEAQRALSVAGYQHNGKRNAAVGEAANHFAAQVDLAALVARSTGLEVEQPHTGVYLGYTAGQFLDFHVDEARFGEANLIICLKHARRAGADKASATVFLSAAGYLECGASWAAVSFSTGHLRRTAGRRSALGRASPSSASASARVIRPSVF
ncbi:hypothetical protein ABT263_18745 [Kitasatospora sp. NPDC001603]|uniref:hypothetical protein n=1 Tax=Kitasatospora sp. NPDC001603 TaxID=3154388 RepID=UPI00332DFD8C